jgi:hypothetical protein
VLEGAKEKETEGKSNQEAKLGPYQLLRHPVVSCAPYKTRDTEMSGFDSREIGVVLYGSCGLKRSLCSLRGELLYHRMSVASHNFRLAPPQKQSLMNQ